MEDSKIRWRIVRRMWNDRIVASQGADLETVARQAVPDSAEGRAKELVEDEMVDDEDCPLQWRVGGEVVALQKNREAVARYIERYGGEEAVPWDLKEVLTDEEDPAATPDRLR